jgi:hypothetical protein
MEKRPRRFSLPETFYEGSPSFDIDGGEGESIRKPSAAQRAWFLSACREESGARTGSGFSSRGKRRVFRMDSPEPEFRSAEENVSGTALRT